MVTDVSSTPLFTPCSGFRPCFPLAHISPILTSQLTPSREDSPTHSLHRIKLGYLARAEESGQPDLEDALIFAAKLISELLEAKKLIPNEHIVASPGGFEGLNEAVALQLKGAGGKKVVVELQDP